MTNYTKSAEELLRKLLDAAIAAIEKQVEEKK